MRHFAGCLIGQCVGDAIGFIVEGKPGLLCARFVEDAVRTNTLEEYSRGSFLFGQYSDDSQLARELLDSWVTRGKFDPEDYARRIAAIFVEDRIVGRGRATEQAARRIAAGIDWQEAGEPAPQAGNGSAMRAAPVGLMCRDPEELIRVAHDQGRITHQDPRCSAGAIAIAGAVYQVLHGGIDIPLLSEWVSRFDQQFGVRIGWLEEHRKLAPADALSPIALEQADQSWGGISPFVVSSVLWSLYSFLRTPDDYRETICTAIAVGGDVDTTAAMAGAISGAHNGLEAIPQAWAQRLEDRGTWMYDELIQLADRAERLK
jgi:ADP-ribosylglycohydrolase